MPRKFVGRSASGNSNDILQRIRRAVRSLRAGAQIRVVFFEKKARGSFYVFLGVEMEPGEDVPELTGLVFDRSGIYGKQVGPLEWAAIRPMLDPREFDTEGAERVPYQPRWSHDAGDLFDDVDLMVKTGESDSGNPEAYRRLLAWLSAAGQGRWETFVRICQVLNLADHTPEARQVFRRLSLLGHVEPGAEGASWSVAPATLVRAASEPSLSFWCGQWTPWLQGQLPETWKSATEQPGNDGPPRILVQPGSVEDGQSVGLGKVSLRVGGIVSSKLADMLPTAEGWKESLQPIVGMTTPHHAERWHDGDYQATTFFRTPSGWDGETGLYRITRGSEKFPVVLTFFFDKERQQLLRGDWYGLRFLALCRDTDCVAQWREEEGRLQLLIPTHQRWPLVYERALVLASGLLPESRYSSSASFLCYSDVPESLAATLTTKLGVKLLRGV